MTAARQALGRRAEALVERELRQLGWTVLARNVRVAALRGELDLIALDPAHHIVFVEVKARRAGAQVGPVEPVEAVTAAKRRKLRALAAAWLRERQMPLPPNRGLRFDVVGVRIDAAGRVLEWRHERAAF